MKWVDFQLDRKSTRLNSSHLVISYAVFCLKKKKKQMYAIHSVSAMAASSLITRRRRLCAPEPSPPSCPQRRPSERNRTSQTPTFCPHEHGRCPSSPPSDRVPADPWC